MAGASTSTHSSVELTIDIPDDLDPSFQDAVCIYSVPSTLRQINPQAYTPQVISIGPIHRDDKNLQAMEIQKRRYLKGFCKRMLGNSGSNHEKIKEKEILQKISADLLNKIGEEEMRRCYADNFQLICSTTFVSMILLDSVFILELFLRDHENKEKQKENKENSKDFIIDKPWLSIDVRKDLLLLENQLPFSVLEQLYDLAKPKLVKGNDPPPFLNLTCNYFSYFNPEIWNIPTKTRILHFTDLVRHFWTFNHPDMQTESVGSLYSITKLHRAGLKLKPAGNKSYMKINFEKGTTCFCGDELQIPQFVVDDNTEFIVRNLMALEQCHYPRETYICNYIRLWDLLIDTAQDVDLLVKKKILINGLGGSAAVAELFNGLCNNIAEVKSCYCTLSNDMNRYYENCCNHTWANLKSVYFKDLWTGTGTVAATLLLVFTATQAACSIWKCKAPVL